MEPERVLIIGMTSEKGGRETFIMELYRRVDRSRIQFDFIYTLPNQTIACADEIRELGGKIYYIPMIRKAPVAHYSITHRILKENHYRAVYYHANSLLKNADIFRLAAQHHVPLRILHSHNTSDITEPPLYQKIRQYKAKKEIDRYVTHRFSCSKEAGLWMFGDDAPFQVINNGIDTARFDYNPVTRNSVREQAAVGNRTVYGTVARFFYEKNPFFLIDIFTEIHKRQPDSVFWHIGGGKLEPQLREKIADLGLEDAYFLLGRKDNVQDYLSAMDLFLLPSIYEGFPITLVEAQTSGLRCLVSDTITPDVNITGNVSFLSLKDSPGIWADQAISLTDYHREPCRELLMQKGYDVNLVVTDFEKLILT